jgi:hypothetical protein
VRLSKYCGTLYSTIALSHCGKVIQEVESVLQQHHDRQRAETDMEHRPPNDPIEAEVSIAQDLLKKTCLTQSALQVCYQRL